MIFLKDYWKLEQSNEELKIILIENKTCENFHNEVPMEKMFENYLNFKIKSNKVIVNKEEQMKMNL